MFDQHLMTFNLDRTLSIFTVFSADMVEQKGATLR